MNRVTDLDRRKHEVDTGPCTRAAVGTLLALTITQVGIHLLLQGLIYSCLETKRALAVLSSIFHIKHVSYAVGILELTSDICKKGVFSNQIHKQERLKTT